MTTLLPDDLLTHLENEFRRYYPTMTRFDAHMNDECDDYPIIIQFHLDGATEETTLSQINSGMSDEDYYVFEFGTTGRTMTIPYMHNDEDR